MSADTTGTDSHPAPTLTQHAVERWIERVCHHHPGVAPWDLPDAFNEAVPVGIPDDTARGRLHAPTGSVIVYTHDWHYGPPVLITVLFAEKMALNDDHLKVCADCDLRYDPADGSCSWCSET